MTKNQAIKRLDNVLTELRIVEQNVPDELLEKYERCMGSLDDAINSTIDTKEFINNYWERGMNTLRSRNPRISEAIFGRTAHKSSRISGEKI